MSRAKQIIEADENEFFAADFLPEPQDIKPDTAFEGPINRNGHEIRSQREAFKYLKAGGSILVLGYSGARAFEVLGFKKAIIFDSTSSAGDWSYAVFDGARWFPAWQDNNWPRAGYLYSVDFNHGFGSVESCFNHMEFA